MEQILKLLSNRLVSSALWAIAGTIWMIRSDDSAMANFVIALNFMFSGMCLQKYFDELKTQGEKNNEGEWRDE